MFGIPAMLACQPQIEFTTFVQTLTLRVVYVSLGKPSVISALRTLQGLGFLLEVLWPVLVACMLANLTVVAANNGRMRLSWEEGKKAKRRKADFVVSSYSGK